MEPTPPASASYDYDVLEFVETFIPDKASLDSRSLTSEQLIALQVLLGAVRDLEVKWHDMPRPCLTKLNAEAWLTGRCACGCEYGDASVSFDDVAATLRQEPEALRQRVLQRAGMGSHAR